MRGLVRRGLDFERAMAEVLRADAALPRPQRRFLGDFDRPRVETFVGVWKSESGLRFADVLVIDEGPPSGGVRRVETFSFKSRKLAVLDESALSAQMLADARQALGYYGNFLDIRRPSLKPLVRGDDKVFVSRVRLIYEGGDFKPSEGSDLNRVVSATEESCPGVEVSFQ